jgi:hypothetical protein
MGFAWDAGGKGKNVIRGGWGLSYDRMATVYPAGYRNNPPLIGIVTAGTQFGTNFTYSLGDLSKPLYLGYPVDASLATGLNAQNGIIGQRLSLIGVTYHMRQPYTMNWFFGIQRSLPGNIVIEADYLGSGGRHLVHIANINRFTGDLLNGGLFHGFNPSFSTINMLDTGGSSAYHGGTFTARKAMSHGVMFQATYTYSKVIDVSEDEQGVTSFSDVNSRLLDRSAATFDVPQRLSFSSYWDIPFLGGCRAWYCKAAGGWQLAGYGIFDNGMPFSVSSTGAYPNGDYNADGNTGDRPNAPLTPIQTSGFSRQQLLVNGIFTVSQFPVPALGTNGNLGRNTFRAPGFARVDTALTKNFHVTERFNLRFRMEAYNVFNHTNLNAPSGTLNSNTFGKVTSSAISRQLRASLLLRF